MTTSRSMTRRGAVRLAAAATALPLVHIGTAAVAGLAATMATMRRASAGDTTGVTATEIKIGHTNPYSGPASSYSSSGRLEMAFFNKMVNDQEGSPGAKSTSSPTMTSNTQPKTVEQAVSVKAVAA